MGAVYFVFVLSLAGLAISGLLNAKLWKIWSGAVATASLSGGIIVIWWQKKRGEKRAAKIEQVVKYLTENNLNTPEATKVLAEHIQNHREIGGEIGNLLQKHSGLMSLVGTFYANQLLSLGARGAASLLLLLGAYLVLSGIIQAITIIIDPGIATRELIAESLRHEITLEIMSQKIKAGPPNTR